MPVHPWGTKVQHLLSLIEDQAYLTLDPRPATVRSKEPRAPSNGVKVRQSRPRGNFACSLKEKESWFLFNTLITCCKSPDLIERNTLFITLSETFPRDAINVLRYEIDQRGRLLPGKFACGTSLRHRCRQFHTDLVATER
jgi:hypothetical protein